ncbi:MAG: DUF6263 family protein [Candidatus Kapaibacteriota bacterium]
MSKFFLILLFVLLIFACEAKKVADERRDSNLPDSKEFVEQHNSNKFLLELNPELGKEYLFESRLEQKITQKMDTLHAITSHIQKILYAIQPKEKDTFSNYIFLVKFKTIQQNISTQLFTFEVNTQLKSKHKTPLDIFYGNLIDKEFKLTVDKKGKNITIFGVDSLLNSVIGQMSKSNEFKGIDKSMLSQIVGSFFNQNELKKSFEKLFNIYPEQLVTTGDSWEIHLFPTEPIPSKIVNTYTLNSLRNDTLWVNLTSDIQFNKDKVRELDTDLAELSGKQNGHLVLDRRTGMIKDSKIIQQIKLVHKIPPSEQSNNKPLRIVTNVYSVFYLHLK